MILSKMVGNIHHFYRITLLGLLLVITMLYPVEYSWAQVSPSERQALIDLYNATDGDNWRNTTSGNKPWDVGNSSPVGPPGQGNPDSGNPNGPPGSGGPGPTGSPDSGNPNGPPGSGGSGPTGPSNSGNPNGPPGGGTPIPVSEWSGVTVENGKVVEIDLTLNGLRGVIPSSIRNLRHLRKLVLSINEISGVIPADLQYLQSLEVLNLSHNNFEGSISGFIGNLSNLLELSVEGNTKMSGTLPIEIGNLKSLRSLKIQGAIEGTIPSIIGDLTSLKLLYISGERVSGSIPVEIVNLVHLEDVYISKTRISGSIPEFIGNLNALKRLSLQDNQLSGTIPDAVSNLENLESINLSGNQLTGNIPMNIGNLKKLNTLYLEENQFSGVVPTSLYDAVSLKFLNLSENQFSGSISDQIGNMSNLKSIHIENNQFSGKIPSVISTLQDMISFKFANNQFVFADFETEFSTYRSKLGTSFTYSPQARIDQEETITVVAGSGIVLTGQYTTSRNDTVQWFKDGVAIPNVSGKLSLQNITSADAGVYYFRITNSIVQNSGIERNRIILVVEEDSCGVSEIEKLALWDLYQSTAGAEWDNTQDNNQPWSLDIPICQWYGVTITGDHVTAVNLKTNNLEGTLPDSLINLPYLNLLDLGDNGLSGTITPSLGSLLALTSLLLDNNEFIGNIPPALGSLSNLEVLDLGNNNLIGGVPIAICNLRKLQILDLSHNQLSETLVSQLGLLTQLRRLDLSHNQFEGSIPSRIAHLYNLEYLAINDNKMSGSIPVSIHGNSKLLEFYFQYNYFIFSDFEQRHPDYKELLTIGYTYADQGKTDAIETKNATVGHPIEFSTVLSSDYNEYQWYKDNELIPDTTSKVLRIESVNLEDAGTYYLLTTNSVVEGLTLERHPITLEVKETCNVPVTEREALIAIYQATAGVNWNNTLTGDQIWTIEDPEATICDWHGVIVENDRVVGLHLAANNLTGTLPDVFASLPQLKTLQLDHNTLGGLLPPSLTIVSELASLTLDHNRYLFSGLEEDLAKHQSKLGTGVTYIPQAAVASPETRVIAATDRLTVSTTVFTSNDNNYQWYKDGVLIAGATAPEYSIPETAETDSGSYHMETINSKVPGLTILRHAIEVEVKPGGDCLISNAEKQALIDLYTSTDGENWTNNTNWLTDTPICQWHGVTVVDGKLTELVLSNNNLQGTIPESIGDLKNVEVIRLNHNGLIEVIPSTIGSLGVLKTLWLHGNQLSGTIPTAIGNIKSLENLTISNNRLSGQIPAAFGKLTNLETLWLQGNRLSGTIPDELGNLSSLIGIILSSNQLTGTIPQSFSKLQALQSLWISGNKLSGEIPAFLGDLPNLKQLLLNHNQFTGSIPSSLGKLTKISTLSLANNKLTGEIPSSFAELSTLTQLFLNNNQLSGKIPNILNNNPELVIITIQNNNFIFSDFEADFYDYQATLEELFKYTPQAKVDQIETKKVVTGKEVTLTTSLRSQNIQYQWYKDNEPISGATQREYVIGSAAVSDAATYYVEAINTVVTDLTLQRHPIKLEIIQPENCEISDEERLALIDFYLSTGGANWTNTVAENQVWDIDNPASSVCDWYGVTLSEDAKVIGLELPDNNIRGVIPEALQKLSNLQHLDLSKNKLVGAIPGWLGYINTLEIINLRENILTGAIPSEIGDLSKLKIMDLGVNRLCCKIPESIGNLINMEYFDVSENKLEGTLPNSLWTIAPLHTIKVQQNTLHGTISDQILDLQRLKIFWVAHNRFSGVIPQSIVQVSNLYSIHLNNNAFSGDVPQLIPNMQVAATDIQIQHNYFVFSDFEPEHPDYKKYIDTYVYSPQAMVDRTEYITVALGGDAILFTEALTSPNNIYRWYKDGEFLEETTLREINITEITEADLGSYYFLSTNSTIEGLTLERHRIHLRLPGTDPDNPDTAIQSFCISQEEELTIAALSSPISGVSNVNWYRDVTGGEALSSGVHLESETTTYWAEANPGDTRVPLRVIINAGAPGIEEESFQQFTIVQQATVADLQITGANIIWYSKPIGGTAYAITDTLEDEKIYYAQSGENSCRFGVGVSIGVFDADGDEWQSFCATQQATIADLEVEITHPENTLIWYKSAQGTDMYQGTEPLDNNTIYYIAQRDNLGNESTPRKGIIAEIVNIPPPQVTTNRQVFYSNDQVTISELFVVGQHVVWYDDPFEGTAYGPNDVLINGETYYAGESSGDCDQGEENCCRSLDRTEVTVEIREDPKPTLVGCELFKPQPGERYVISGWVREDGVKTINPQTQAFSNNEASRLFVDLLNHLKDKLLSTDPLKRNLPPVYVPDPESRKYDALIPFVRKFSDDQKNLTIYNFKPEKERTSNSNRGPELTVGFSFKLDPASDAPEFVYKTPNVRENGVLKNYKYPLLNQSTMELTFQDVTINGFSMRVTSSFSVQGGSYSYRADNIGDVSFSPPLLFSYERFEQIPDPDYEALTYVNSLLKLTYRDQSHTVIPMQDSDVEFRPEGPVIDGWQQVLADFTIPNEATHMTLSLESRIAEAAASNLNVYFDDIRIHPFSGSMKTFVYDPVTQRLKAELDENNYATYYEYDQEGGLIRVKKETERGVFTIQETRSGNSKNNSGK